jgi:hypothetical protein
MMLRVARKTFHIRGSANAPTTTTTIHPVKKMRMT